MDEKMKRVLELHEVEGKILGVLAPMDEAGRKRVMAVVLCLNSNELAALVVATYTANPERFPFDKGPG